MKYIDKYNNVNESLNVQTALKSDYFEKYNFLFIVFKLSESDNYTYFNYVKELLTRTFDIRITIDSEYLKAVCDDYSDNEFYIVIKKRDYYFRYGWSSISYLEDDDDYISGSFKKIYISSEIDSISKLSAILNKPSYEPRKIERTLESNNTGKYYNPITNEFTIYPYRFKTEKEFKSEYGDHWSLKLGEYMWADDMNYLFGQNYENMNVDIDSDITYRVETDITNWGFWHVTNYMLKKNDTPSYEPRKIERTLESNENRIKYRFKTEDEFIQEYGENWKNEISRLPNANGYGWANMMNYLLGQDFDNKHVNLLTDDMYISETNLIPRGYWYITKYMLKDKDKDIPTYKPRKIERDIL